MKNAPGTTRYEGYDWRFGRRVKNDRSVGTPRPDSGAKARMANAKSMMKARSDADLLRSVKECQKEAATAPVFKNF